MGICRQESDTAVDHYGFEVLCDAIHVVCGPSHAATSAPVCPSAYFNFGSPVTSGMGKPKPANFAVGILIFDSLGLWLRTMPLHRLVSQWPAVC